MWVFRGVITSFLVTVLSLGYVYQRVEIVKAGYSLQAHRKQLSLLIDRNSKLMYNLSRLESPRNLLSSLDAEKIMFAGQRTRHDETYVLARYVQNNAGHK